jgi:hypothetical protein
MGYATELEIKLAAKLYGCRDAAKKLYGKDYQAKMSEYQGYIKAAMVKHNEANEMKAAMLLLDSIKGIDGADMGTMNILAAAVELIEPTKMNISNP